MKFWVFFLTKTSVDNNVLSSSLTTEDLEIYFGDDLTLLIIVIVSKAMRAYGFIGRNCRIFKI